MLLLRFIKPIEKAVSGIIIWWSVSKSLDDHCLDDYCLCFYLQSCRFAIYEDVIGYILFSLQGALNQSSGLCEI